MTVRAPVRFLAFAVAAALASCADPVADGAVVAAVKDVYVVTTRFPAAHGGILIAQSHALAQARAQCDRQGRDMQTLRDEPAYVEATGEARFTVAFRCAERGARTL